MAGETPPVPPAPADTPGARDEAAAGGATPRPIAIAKVVVRAWATWAAQRLVEDFCTVIEGFNVEVERLGWGCRLRGRGRLVAEARHTGTDAVIYLYDWEYKETVLISLRLAIRGKRDYVVAVSL